MAAESLGSWLQAVEQSTLPTKSGVTAVRCELGDQPGGYPWGEEPLLAVLDVEHHGAVLEHERLEQGAGIEHLCKLLLGAPRDQDQPQSGCCDAPKRLDRLGGAHTLGRKCPVVVARQYAVPHQVHCPWDVPIQASRLGDGVFRDRMSPGPPCPCRSET